jgi:hypothetical protein
MRNLTIVAALVAGVAFATPAYAQKAKPLSAQDLADIQQLYARYAWSIDTHEDNGNVYASVFTPDGIFYGPNDSKVQGRDALAKYNLTMGKANTHPTHFNMNLKVEPAPGGATGSCYLLITGGDKPALGMVGTYKDVLVKTGEGWKFKERRLYLNAMPPTPAASN